ncbi:MAG: TolC family protein [Gemmatimonadota bacterium]
MRCSKYCLAVLALAIATPAAGQDRVPEQLSLEEAIALALRNNPQHQLLQNDLEVADAGIRRSYGAFLPELSLRASVSSTYRESQTSLGDFGEPLSQPRPIITKTSAGSQSIGLGSITLFDGGSQFRNLSIAKAERQVATTNILSGENTLRANVTRAYYQIVNAERRIELERRLLTFAEERMQLVERQFRIAAAKQTDLLGAQFEVSQRKQSVADAESNARRLRLDLLQVIGIAGEQPFKVVADLPPITDPATLNAATLIARAVATHPRILASTAAENIAERRVSNSKASRLPSLTLVLPSYGWGATERGLFDAWGQMGAANNSFSFGLSANLPLFSKFQTSFAIAQVNAQAEDARHQNRQARLEVENGVRTALIELERSHRSLVLAQEQATVAQQRLELAQEEYRVGATNFTILQQIIQQNDQAQRSVIEARFNLLNARVALEQAIGGPLVPNN